MAKTKRATHQKRLKTRRVEDQMVATTTTTTTTTTNAGIAIKLLIVFMSFISFHAMPDINNVIDFTSNYTLIDALYIPIDNNNNNRHDNDNEDNEVEVKVDDDVDIDDGIFEKQVSNVPEHHKKDSSGLQFRSGVIRAIIHMGVHKTGTSTIQHYTINKKDELLGDNYDMPWHVDQRKKTFRRKKYQYGAYGIQHNFAKCFLPQNVSFACMPKLLDYGSEIAQRKQNLLVSSEWFGHIDSAGLEKLKEYLLQWDHVTIVVYYRRFYEYIHSMYRQFRTGNNEGGSIFTYIDEHLDQYGGDWESNLVEHGRWSMMYTTPLVKRLRDHFREDEIVVRNFHNDLADKKLGERFFCDVLPFANRTCEAIHAEHRPIVSNTQKTSPAEEDYLRFLSAAQSAGLVRRNIPKPLQAKLLAELKKREQTVLNNTTISEYPKVCPLPDTLEQVWNITLESETMFVPEKIEDPHYASELRVEFETAARTILCELDVKTLLHKLRMVLKNIQNDIGMPT